MLKRIQPKTAAAGIAAGIQKRRSSVTVPHRWRPVSTLRGVAALALDAKFAGDTAFHQALAQLEGRLPTTHEEVQ
ncbi:hypothetical protein EV643_103522 [Kribbella sp. VKM Ac-2527]|uniref:Uncharacterized protein n=1 Tax=Kribbella caucasensis TaxID=2512215 RepID=A0A4R6KKS9_9ACTN|nr:hypothetical protein [Kribbella sp. VKM Ac-2527]TDO51783.1 hypothetical protein EV643_103522 [Kribbella sp. VKM Ac-2527]